MADLPSGPSASDRAAGREKAVELARFAESVRKQGLTKFADALGEAAELMGRLADG